MPFVQCSDEEFLIRLFLRKEVTETGCWLWIGSCKDNGYCTVGRNFKHIYVHRTSWELVNGEIPTGKHVLHKCDVRNCFNPDHLFLGTPKDNAHDRDSKGRGNYAKKLTKEIAELIRRDRKKGMILVDLAKKYGSSFRNISLICLNKIWR